MNMWISVNDRLPTENGKYICCVKGYVNSRYIDICCFAQCAEKVDKYDFEGRKDPVWYFYDSEYGYCETTNITHWMPLPEMPEEET